MENKSNISERARQAAYVINERRGWVQPDPQREGRVGHPGLHRSPEGSGHLRLGCI